MIPRFSEAIQKWAGWCPNANSIRTSGHTGQEAEFGNARKRFGPERDPDPEPAGAMVRDHPEYKENMLLILIAVAWLFPVVYQREFYPIIAVLSAVAMYCDAQDIHAGRNFEKETLLGNVVAWRPLTWGAATLVGGIIIMAIYLFHRKEIFNANRRTECS
jgi:hypothetical protein